MSDLREYVRAAIAGDRTRIARGGASVVAICAMAGAAPAVAQQAATPNAASTAQAAPASSSDTQLQEVVITGFRKSLQSAQEIKRDSDEVVDSINASDIGELPDRSVTEAIQRIPGVSINRFAAGVDPDHFSVEGSGVVIRGLPYVQSEFNGRETFSANNGRALSFADVPAELLAGVDVFKSPSADRIEGGIAGVVNLRTRMPFDAPGASVSGSLEDNYGDFAKKSSPSGSILGSDRWNTDMGQFGLLGSFSSSDLKSRADRISVSNFAPRTEYSNGNVATSPGATVVGPVEMPRGAVAGTQVFNRKRLGYDGVVQWQSPDDAWEANAQFLRSDSRESWTENTTEIATDNVAANGTDSIATPGTTLSFAPSGLFTNGEITGATGWRADQQGTAARTPIDGLQSNQYTRGVEQRYVTDDASAHITWHARPDLKFDLDAQHVRSTVDDLDVEMNISSYQDAFIQLHGSAMPLVLFEPPTNCSPTCSGALGTANNPSYISAGHQSFADPYNSFYRSSMDHIERSDGFENAFRLDGDKSIDGDWIKSIKAGLRYADRNQVARFSTYNWGVLSEQWGNGGPVWLDTPVVGNGGMPLSSFSVNTLSNFFQGKVPSPLGAQGRLFYNGNPADNYAGFIKYSNMINQTWEAVNADGTNQGWNALQVRPGDVSGTPFLPAEINPEVEKNSAAYVMANLAHKMSNGWKLTGNVGFRFTRTSRSADGGQQFVQGTFANQQAQCPAAILAYSTALAAYNANPVGAPPSPPSLFCLATTAQQNAAIAWANGAYIPGTASTSYSFVLPSINLKLDTNNGWQYRADYFKGVTPPDFGLTRNDYNVTLGYPPGVGVGSNDLQGGATNGNPYLRPTWAHNFDLTAEWYFSHVGSLTGALFYKELHDVVTNGTQVLPLTNNGVTYPSYITTAVNTPGVGKIAGYELAYQQTFDKLPGWANGFGIDLNYTYATSKGVKQSTLSATDPNVAAGNTSTVDTSKLPLVGLSKYTVNVAPFYQKGPVEIRLAYSWRSAFLLTTRDVIVPYQPIMNDATGQLDASVFYSINDHFKLGLQAANLNDEIVKTSAVLNNFLLAPRSYYISDRRYTLGVRWTL